MATVRRLRADAADAFQRGLVVVAGERDWCIALAGSIVAEFSEGRRVWISDASGPIPTIALHQATGLIGTECDLLVYDAHGGFDPDGFGAATGTVRGGGLLVLAVPDLNTWPDRVDPQAGRIAVHPFDARDLSGRFIKRLVTVLRSAQYGTLLIEQGSPIASHSPFEVPESTPEPCIAPCHSADQEHAVDCIVKVGTGRAHRPLVITADRGRGKSSALGLAAARLIGSGAGPILVTGPNRAAVDPVFNRAGELLGDDERYRSELMFEPPDALQCSPRPARLLMVDEAAAIPAPLLERLLQHYSRIVFSTTIHGYEGTGRGFEVRFQAKLDRLAPLWHGIRLETPIRWARDDPLESTVARALLLDAAGLPDEEARSSATDRLRYARVDRDRLVDDEVRLRQLFGLLVSAHYQTRPLDLRHLLDGPNIAVYVAEAGRRIAATALVAHEGRLDPELSAAIFEGRRRPRGHLLPQTLSAHAGLEAAPALRMARIIRIAVHPALRGRGIGRALLARIYDDAAAQGLDALGASFGVTADLLAFWTRCSFEPVHLGVRRNAASGLHAAVVMRPVTPAGARLVCSARERLAGCLIALLPGPLRALEADLAARLLAAVPPPQGSLSNIERRELNAFAHALRPYEPTLPVLNRLIACEMGPALTEGALTLEQAELAIACALQYRPLSEVGSGRGGRQRVIDALRSIGAILLERGLAGVARDC